MLAPLKDLNELKEITQWMKAEKVQSFKLGELGIEITFAPDALKTTSTLILDDVTPAVASENPDQLTKEDEALLYYSAG